MQLTEEEKAAFPLDEEMLSSDDEDIKEEEREKFLNTLKWT